MIGIIGAMDEELERFKEDMKMKEKLSIANFEYITGKIMDTEVVMVKCGIGKVNAAICTQILILKFDVNAIINTGVAGALKDDLDIGDIVISDEVLYHDFDVTAFGYKRGVIPRMETSVFKADRKLVNLALKSGKRFVKSNNIVVGRVLSGDKFINNKNDLRYLFEEFGGYAVEMEGAAIGHCAHLNKIPFVIIRSISDRADVSAKIDYRQFVKRAAENSSDIVKGMLAEMSQR